MIIKYNDGGKKHLRKIIYTHLKYYLLLLNKKYD
jgi:hypothetical protein